MGRFNVKPAGRRGNQLSFTSKKKFQPCFLFQFFQIKAQRRLTDAPNETLEILFGNVPYSVDSRFREVDFGDFEMKSYEMLKGDPAYQAWLTGDNEANTPPGGESGTQMTRRVLEAFSELPDGTALVAHGGVIAAIMASLFPEEGKHRYQWQPRNGHGYEIHGDTYRPIP